ALELPSTGWERRYRVRALGRVTQEALDKLKRGVTVTGVRYGPIEAALDREQGAQGANVWLTVSLREGKNREVRRVLEHLGLKVNRLIRVSYGPFELGELDEGAVEEVETQKLREALGAALIRATGMTGRKRDTVAVRPTGAAGRVHRDRNNARGRRTPALASHGRAEVGRGSADQRPPARGAVQYSRPCLRRPG
ncbi:MAG: hypothetical protein P8Y53_17880, partial [Pseudolabrys sp.]